jgi:hypothetical protein
MSSVPMTSAYAPTKLIRSPKASRPVSTGSSPRKGIDAPDEERYRPVWSPPEERPTFDFRAAGISAIVRCIGFRIDYT